MSLEYNTVIKRDYSEAQKCITSLKEHCKSFYQEFEMFKLISTGPTGAVFKGILRKEKNCHKKDLALKFIFGNKKPNHEATILRRLKDKHIANIYGYYSLKDKECIVMEYYRYGDLESFKRYTLKCSYLSESLLLYIAGGVIEALNYIHIKNKIIHMDINPQNILLDKLFDVKLIDFSVSCNYKESLQTLKLPLVGTDYYMSPEVLRQKTIDVKELSKIDLYSFGVTLYYLAFGVYPYDLNGIQNYDQIAKKIDETNLEFPSDMGYSKMFQNFLINCLHKDIKKRYDIYQAKNDPWLKGYQILLDEKEKLENEEVFMNGLRYDYFLNLNEYLHNKCQ